MKIKKNDKVLIIAGKDKGKTGKVLKVFPKKERAVVENLNLVTRHRRPRKTGEKGQRIKIPAPLHISNLKLICPKCNKATRIGYQIVEKKKQRICKKCSETI